MRGWRTWMGRWLVLAFGVTAAGAEDRPALVPPEAGKRLPGSYSVTRVGLLPITAASGRALVHTEQYLAFAGDPAELEGVDIVDQTRAIVAELDEDLRYFRSGLDKCMRVHVVLKRAPDRAAVQAVISGHLKGGLPAISFVVGDLPVASALVGIDAVGFTTYDTKGYASGRQAIVSVRKGRWGSRLAFLPGARSIFVSGQSVKGKNPAESARKTLAQLGETLGFLQRGWTNVVQIKIFLRDPITNAGPVHEAVATLFKPEERMPPQVFVEWTAAADLEMELVVDGGPEMPDLPPVEYLTPPGLKASPAFSRVVRVNHGRLVYTSGVTGAGGAPALDQAKAILGEIDTSMAVFRTDAKHLVKATYYVSDTEAGQALNEVRGLLYDPSRPPAASKALVKGMGLPGASLSVEMIGVAAGE